MYGLFVAVGTAARELNEERILGTWPCDSAVEVISPLPDVIIARFTPSGSSESTGFIWSENRQMVVCVDGYLLSNRARTGAGREEHLRAFVRICQDEGCAVALRSPIGGACNLVVVDVKASQVHVKTDYIASIPLFYSELDNGWLISSNPVALVRTGMIDNEIDMTACAEGIYYGYTFGNRSALRGIKITDPLKSFCWQSDHSRGAWEKSGDSPWNILPSEDQPSVDQLADGFLEACRRHSAIDPRPAHLQSAGKDSRLILAGWPQGYNPPCYTHGNPESHEVHIARSVANLRGSEWTHVWPDGDDVAQRIPDLFNASGLIVFPDRLFAAEQMRDKGHVGTLDGFFGDIGLGNSYYSISNRRFSLITRMLRFATIHVDQKVSKIGLDRITEMLYSDILEVRNDRWLLDYISPDFVEQLSKCKHEILHDISNQVKRAVPDNDSFSILIRSFMLANRSCHSIVQQGVVSRMCVNIYYPFSADIDYLRAQLHVRPERAVFNKLYFSLYRRRFPEYCKLLYGATLLPMNRSPLSHKLSVLLLSRNMSIPYVTGNAKGKERDANSWGIWLQESHRLREVAAGFLREGGILNEKNWPATSDAIASGQKRGIGKIFHLAAVAKWIAMSNGKGLSY